MNISNSLHGLFEEQAKKTPNNIALVSKNKSLTYKKLDEKSNQLANWMRQNQKIGVGDYVALCLTRSEWMIIAILAVLKTGAAYVPVDPDYPNERIQYILSETKAKLILSSSVYSKKIKELTRLLSKLATDEILASVALDNEAFLKEISLFSTNNLINSPNRHSYENLAYVLFTSGTTGNPKGVMVRHSGVINLVTQAFSHYKINVGNHFSSFLFFANYVFDVHAWEIFSCLLFGHKLYIAEQAVRHDIKLLCAFVEKNKITYGLVTPGLLDTQHLLMFDTLIVAGDRVSQPVIEYYLKNGIKLINGYGPTEASILSSMHLYENSVLPNNIGKPIANIEYYVLDESHQPVSIGEKGELYIAGLGVAAGYLNQPDLTNQAFLDNSFSSASNKIYKTGDRVRLLETGEYEFIGRNDFQVKLRGHRIELGEIEHAINLYPGISQSLVLIKSLHQKANHCEEFIVGYYVANEPISYDDLLAHLKTRVPVYMLPTAFVHLEVLPLNYNGKVDKQALPEPSLRGRRVHKSAENSIEKIILSLWADVLHLSVQDISTDVTFYSLGGNSISIVSLLHAINEKFGSNFSVLDVLNSPTVADLANKIKHSTSFQTRTLSNLVNSTVTPSEQIILRDYYSTEYKNIYNESFLVEFDYFVDEEKIKSALLTLVNHHEILRVNYIHLNGNFKRVLREPIELENLSWSYQDLSDKAITKDAFELILSQETQKVFQVDSDSLIRFCFYKLEDETYRLFIIFFHAILDGTSVINILLPELEKLLREENKDALSPMNKLSELDKAGALIEYHYATKEQQSLKYWKDFFTQYDVCSINNLLGDERNLTGKQLTFKIDSNIKNRLVAVAMNEGVSLFDVLLGAFYVLLMKFSNQKALVIRTNIDERIYYPEFLNMSGCLINNVFCGVSIEENWTVRELLKNTEKQKNLAISNTTQFSTLLKYFREKTIALSGIHFNIEPETSSELSYKQSQILTHSGQVKNNLYVELDIKPKEILGRVEFKSSLFSDVFIHSFIQSYQIILENLDNYLLSNVQDVSLVPHIPSFRGVQQPTHSNMNISLSKIFEMQSIKYAERIALYSENREITYGELNAKSNQIAHYLRDICQIQSEDLIGLCFDRTEQSLVALLGILKAGAAYVPMDPHTPDERLAYIISDTKMKQVLTQSAHQSRLENVLTTGHVLALDSHEMQKILCKQPSENLLLDIPFDQLAYIIYTSGTTGKPKGVMQTHQNVVRLFSATEHWYGFTEKDVWTLFHSIVFDFSVWEMWGALLHGGKLVIPTYDETRDLNLFYALCLKTGVTVLNQTPSAFYQFMEVVLQEEKQFNNRLLSKFAAVREIGGDSARRTGVYTRVHEGSSTESTNKFSAEVEFRKKSNLRYVIFGGEALNISQLRPWFERYGFRQPQLINMYGITETTVHVTYKLLTESDLNEGVSSIGEVIPDQDAYVLDSHLNPLPIGAIGELYVGGAGLARGYWNRSELTTERFISNPYQTVEEKALGVNARLYKTGDLVSWQSERNLEYRGRNDSQVKIRGYRIELGEIESVLSQHDLIKQAVVLAKEHPAGGSYLVAYYVADQAISADVLKMHLEALLPDYMVPNIYLHLTTFPLTINGKLDRAALPEPSFVQPTIVVSPRTELEQQVSAIWAELLAIPLDTFNIQDDFFHLGGDSIVCIQLVSRLRQRLSIHLSVKDVFTHKTVERLYDHVISQLSVEKIPHKKTESGILSGPVNLLPVQEWFFENDVVDAHHWNQAFMIKVPLLDKNKLENCLKKLVEHHDALRLRYAKKGHEIQQHYVKDIQVPEISSQDISFISESALQAILTEWQSNFDLQHGPLFHVGYLTGYADGSARLHFAFHHLIMDSVSWRIIIEDLRCLYEGGALAPKSSSYRQWSEAVQHYAENHEAEKKYWNNILFRHCEKLSSGPGASRHFTLNITQTENLLSGIHHVYQTQINDVLLSALSLALFQLTGECDHSILLEGHGREEINDTLDITRTVGWFTTMYPVQLMSKSNALETLKNTKEMLRKIPNKGIGYGSFHGYHAKILPKISFNYLGQFEQSINTIWALTNEKVGETTSSVYGSPLLININAWVINGELQFSLDGQLVQESMDELAEYYQQSLEKLIKILKKTSRRYLTTSDVDNVINQEYLDEIQANREVEAVYLANNLQQGFIYHSLTQGQVDQAYRLQIFWEYENELNINYLKQAWQLAVDKYPSLRLRFAWDNELIQIIDKQVDVEWKYTDSLTVEEVILRDSAERYNLAEGKLFRVHLIKKSNNHYFCLLSNHHAILDGWSMSVLLNYVHDSYLKLLAKTEVSIEKEHTYKKAQHYFQTHMNNDESYWNNRISDQKIVMNLSGLLSCNQRHIKLNTYKNIINPASLALKLDRENYRSLKNLGKKFGVTLGAMVYYALHKTLSLYSHSQKTIIGTVISGRNIPIDHLEQSVGLYINTLPSIIEHDKELSLIAMMQQVQNSINEANDKSNVSLAKLQPSSGRLFDCLFVYENYPESSQDFSDQGLNIHSKGSLESHDYPLALLTNVIDEQEILELQLHYAGELFDVERMREVLDVVGSMLVNLENPTRILPKNQLETLNKFAVSEESLAGIENNIISKFEEQVSKFPEHIAVVYKNKTITYAELNKQANQLAQYLKKAYGVAYKDKVALYFERSPQMLISILALLKLGAVYVPIDPAYPIDRLKFIFDDIDCHLVMTELVHRDIFWDLNTDHLCIDDEEDWVNINAQIAESPKISISNSDLAYILYTSGSTGQPKGVMIEQGSLINYVMWLASYAHLSETSVVDCSSSFSFDFTVSTSLAPLCFGGKVVLCEENVKKDPVLYHQHLLKQGITLVKLTPSYVSVLLPEILAGKSLNALKRIVIGGEAARKEDIISWLQHYPAHCFHNEYGPTEATVAVSQKEINIHNLDQLTMAVSIGRPALNTKLYILDNHLKLLPIGAMGELYIGGHQVAQGYYQREDLMKDCFIPNPFNVSDRLYKTGDLVRWNHAGELEYLGRVDNQIKVRGYRVELSEIEQALLQYVGVKQVVVVAKNYHEMDLSLVAYITSALNLEEKALLSFLAQKLPAYLIPDRIMQIATFPLTVNGKLDVDALPNPATIINEHYQAPRTELELSMSQLYATILGLDNVNIGITDDFFTLGGNSISSIRLANALKKEAGLNVDVISIFKHRTIDALIKHALVLKQEEGGEILEF